MIPQELKTLLTYCDIESSAGSLDKTVSGICYNSKTAGPGYIFVAVKGLHTDGHLYIEDAIAMGATIIISEHAVPRLPPNITGIKVKDARLCLAALSAAFFDFPANKLKLVGVTGTDGKSSVVWFIYQLLAGCGITSGFFSTVEILTGDRVEANTYRQSTPESLEINTFLSAMLENNKQAAIVEATSHGLSHKTGRLAGIGFSAAVFTNITHEHLEFHGTFEQYRYDKANLFRQLRTAETSFGVVNAGDPNGIYFRQATAQPVFSYGLDCPADMSAHVLVSDIKSTTFQLNYQGGCYTVTLNIPGDIYVENILAALLTAVKLYSLDLVKLLSLVPGITPPRGRLYSIELGQPFHVIVDYAHTPKSFEKIYSLIRPLTKKRLISVFGSAGERDVIKRPAQGQVAARFSDVVILTDEDPRGEDSMKILQEIKAGCQGLEQEKNLFQIPNREAAIAFALKLAQADDTVLLLGKGHEASIIYASGSLPWNEIEVTQKLIRNLQQL